MKSLNMFIWETYKLNTIIWMQKSAGAAKIGRESDETLVEVGDMSISLKIKKKFWKFEILLQSCVR